MEKYMYINESFANVKKKKQLHLKGTQYCSCYICCQKFWIRTDQVIVTISMRIIPVWCPLVVYWTRIVVTVLMIWSAMTALVIL